MKIFKVLEGSDQLKDRKKKKGKMAKRSWL